LIHTIRMALRNQLQAAGGFQFVESLTLSEADSRALADVALGVKSADSGSFVLKHIQRITEPRDTLINYLRHAGRYADESALSALGGVVRAKFPDDPDAQFASYKSVQEGFAQRGSGLSDGLRAWAGDLAGRLLAANESKSTWVTLPAKGAESSKTWASTPQIRRR
jgi:hypothetical protein